MTQDPGKSHVSGKSRNIPRRLSRLVSLVRAESGVSAVEFAMVAPVLMGLLVPVADLGMAYTQQIQVQQAAQAGAQYALLHGYSSSAIADAVTAATKLASVNATPAPSQSCGCPTGTAIAAASCGSSCSDGETAGSYVVVNAQSPYSPVLPYSVLGFSMILRAQATVRIQ